MAKSPTKKGYKNIWSFNSNFHFLSRDFAIFNTSKKETPCIKCILCHPCIIYSVYFVLPDRLFPNVDKLYTSQQHHICVVLCKLSLFSLELLFRCLGTTSACLSPNSIPSNSSPTGFLSEIGETLVLDFLKKIFDGRTFFSFFAAYLLQCSNQPRPMEINRNPTWEVHWLQSRRLEAELQRDRHWLLPTARLCQWDPDIFPVFNSKR